MPRPEPPAEPRATPLGTCPDCGGILEPATPGWQTFVHTLQPDPAPMARDQTNQWQCLICGYRRP